MGVQSSFISRTLYIDGFFVKNTAQTLILEPYFTNPSFKVGWTVTERFVTPEDDTTFLIPI